MISDIRLASKSECTGCAVCHDVCPQGCITMDDDKGLHWYPFIDREKCIKCGKCLRVCPALNDTLTCDFKQKFYASWSSDPSERKQGTSGGVGTALSRYALSQGWMVVGAGFDEQWVLNHKIISNAAELVNLRGSKYLQSKTTDTYKQVEQLVLSGKHVFFIGTPCQIEALKRIIPLDKHGQITTCGIICHGVNSSRVWKDFVHYIEKRHGSGLEYYNFRSKVNGWGENSRGGKRLYVEYKLKSRKKHVEPAWKNLFHHWFGLHLIMRECCFSCKYRVMQRNSDITIGDFWGLNKILPELKNTDDGVSVAIASTPHGQEIIEKCDALNLIPTNENKTPKVLAGFLDTRDKDKVSAELDRMKLFEKEYEENGVEVMRRKYPTDTVWKKTLRSILFHIGIK